jgi:hypothetical protein
VIQLKELLHRDISRKALSVPALQGVLANTLIVMGHPIRFTKA